MDPKIFILIGSTFGVLTFFILILIFSPFITRKYNELRLHMRRKVNNLADDAEKGYEYEILLLSENDSNPQLSYVVDYNNRKNQLSIGILKMILPISSWRQYVATLESKLYFIVYLNGDDSNSPCLSQQKYLSLSMFINEIFVFTIKPYDIQNIMLNIKLILVSNNFKYNVGFEQICINEIDPNLYNTPQVSLLNNLIMIPDQILESSMLCISFTSCNNFMKLKIIRLFLIDCDFPEDNTMGINVCVTIDGPNGPQKVESTIKKFKSLLLFNEVFIIDGIVNIESIKAINIDINEIKKDENDDDDNIKMNICGKLNQFNKGLLDHLKETMNNFDMEIIKWHFIPYKNCIL